MTNFIRNTAILKKNAPITWGIFLIKSFIAIVIQQTVQALNSIPVNQINDFMNSLIENRMDSLRTMRNWPTAQGGWTTRTSAY